VAAATLIAAAGHLAQMALWAAALLGCGEFGDFGTAFYHSAVNYPTFPRWTAAFGMRFAPKPWKTQRF